MILGTTDLAFAMSFWGFGYGASPVRVLQSVARGVLGAGAFKGGAGSAVLGAALHYTIALGMALTYYAVSRRFDALARRPVAYGVAYGAVLFLIMNFVVLPLSAVGMPRFDNTPWVGLSVVMHLVFGAICALATRAASAERPGQRSLAAA